MNNSIPADLKALIDMSIMEDPDFELYEAIEQASDEWEMQLFHRDAKKASQVSRDKNQKAQRLINEDIPF